MLKLPVSLLFIAVSISAFAQGGPMFKNSNEPFSMKGIHTVVFSAGYWAVSGQSSGSTESSSEKGVGGFVASLSHKFWLSNRWAVGPNISVLDTGAKSILNANQNTRKSILLTSILFGIHHAFIPSQGPVNVLFYVSTSLGPYMSSTVQDSQNASTSVIAFGVQPLAGFTWFLNNWLIFDFAFGYHIVADFDMPVGQKSNFSGMEFCMGLGLAL